MDSNEFDSTSRNRSGDNRTTPDIYETCHSVTSLEIPTIKKEHFFLNKIPFPRSTTEERDSFTYDLQLTPSDIINKKECKNSIVPIPRSLSLSFNFDFETDSERSSRADDGSPNVFDEECIGNCTYGYSNGYSSRSNILSSKLFPHSIDNEEALNKFEGELSIEQKSDFLNRNKPEKSCIYNDNDIIVGCGNLTNENGGIHSDDVYECKDDVLTHQSTGFEREKRKYNIEMSQELECNSEYSELRNKNNYLSDEYYGSDEEIDEGIDSYSKNNAQDVKFDCNSLDIWPSANSKSPGSEYDCSSSMANSVTGGLSEIMIVDEVESAQEKQPGGWIQDKLRGNWTLPSVHGSHSPISLPHTLFSKLYSHQKEGIGWLWKLHEGGIGGVLGDDMGLGKTCQCASFLAGLFNTGQIRSALILAPKSVLRGWEKELHVWLLQVCPKIEISVLIPDLPIKRREIAIRSALCGGVYKKGAICVSTYGMVASNPDLFQDRMCNRSWDYVILDEGHKVKNPKTKLSKAVHKLPTIHRLLVTGTPIQNNLKELWTLMDWCCSRKLLGTYASFEKNFCKAIEQGQDRDASALQVAKSYKKSSELWSLLRPYLLQRSKACLNDRNDSNGQGSAIIAKLRTKTEVVIWVSLSNEQRSAYHKFLESGRVKDVLTGQKNPLASITLLKKICGHPLLLMKGDGIQIPNVDQEDDSECEDDTSQLSYSRSKVNGNPKVQWSLDSSIAPTELEEGSVKLKVVMKLLEHLVEKGHRTLVFTQSVRVLDILQRCLNTYGITYVRIDGKSSDVQRSTAIDSFNKFVYLSVCLLTTKVGGYGINLVGADRVIVFDPSWNPAEDRQAVDRAYRIGQTKDVVVYRMITAGTVEEKMYEKQIYKDGLRHSVLDSQGANGKSWGSGMFSRAELKELFTLGLPAETRVLTQLEARHGRIHDLLRSSGDIFQQKLTTPGGHIDFIQSLDSLGAFGVSLHGNWKESEVRNTENFLKSPVIDLSGLDATLEAFFPDQKSSALENNGKSTLQNNQNLVRNKPTSSFREVLYEVTNGQRVTCIDLSTNTKRNERLSSVDQSTRKVQKRITHDSNVINLTEDYIDSSNSVDFMRDLDSQNMEIDLVNNSSDDDTNIDLICFDSPPARKENYVDIDIHSSNEKTPSHKKIDTVYVPTMDCDTLVSNNYVNQCEANHLPNFDSRYDSECSSTLQVIKSVCEKCSEISSQFNYVCNRCPCNVSLNNIARYDFLLNKAEIAEGSIDLYEAMKRYLECLAICDFEPILHRKIAQLGLRLGFVTTF